MNRMSFPTPFVNAAAAVILSSTAFLSQADDWPVYRGPAGTGISQEAGLRDSGEAKVAWKAEVGLGYSAPVISGPKPRPMKFRTKNKTLDETARMRKDTSPCVMASIGPR